MGLIIPDSASLLHICYGKENKTPLAEAEERMEQVRAAGYGYAFTRPVYKYNGHDTYHHHPELDIHHYEVYGMPNKPTYTGFYQEEYRKKKKQEQDKEPTEEDLKQLEQET